MRPQTVTKYSAYKADKQKKYNTYDQTGAFNVEPELIIDELNLIRQTDEFLSLINLVPVAFASENVIGLGSGSLIAAKVDTSKGGTRTPRPLKPFEKIRYACSQVNFDTQIPFGTLDAFAHHFDFNDRVEHEIHKHMNLDLIRLGFFGKESADDSDCEANPNGEDVAKGWIQKLREQNASAMLTAEGGIQIGEGGTYATVNDAVQAVKNKLPARYRNVNDLVVLLGSDLVAYDKANFYPRRHDVNKAIHQIPLRQIKESYGAMPAFMPSCFPARGIMVTSFENLSIYFLASSMRRTFGKQNDRSNTMDNYESMAIDYVVENVEKAAAMEFETVQLKRGDSWK